MHDVIPKFQKYKVSLAHENIFSTMGGNVDNICGLAHSGSEPLHNIIYCDAYWDSSNLLWQ